MTLRDMNQGLKAKAKVLKTQIGTLYFAYKDPKTPLPAKILAMIVVAYALSPIDLIPDFIPFFGYLDDVILLPLGIALAIRLIPDEVFEASRLKAERYFESGRKKNWIAASVIILLWLLILLQIINRVFIR